MRHTSEADYGVCSIDPEVLYLGIPSLLVYTPTGGTLGDFVHALIVDFRRENCSGGVFAGTYVVVSVHSFFLFSSVAANMISPTTAKTEVNPTTAQTLP